MIFFLPFLKSVYYKINTQSGFHLSCHKYRKQVAFFFFKKKITNTVHFPFSLFSPATATNRQRLWGEEWTADRSSSSEPLPYNVFTKGTRRLIHDLLEDL